MPFAEDSDDSLQVVTNIDDYLESNYPDIQSAADDIFGDSTSSDILAPPSNDIEEHRKFLMNVTSVDGAAVALCGILFGVQDPELGSLILKCYSGLHPSDMFHPNTEPLPGSYTSRFCWVDLHSVERPGLHAFRCYKKEFLQSLAARLNERYPISKCTAMILKSDADRRVKKQVDETVQECSKVSMAAPRCRQIKQFTTPEHTLRTCSQVRIERWSNLLLESVTTHRRHSNHSTT
jgi:hypothetical protein